MPTTTNSGVPKRGGGEAAAVQPADRPGAAARSRTAAGVLAALLGMIAPGLSSGAPEEKANLDEAAVTPYTLPDVLAGPDGRPATTAAEWREVARPHQLRLLEQSVYGRWPAAVPVAVVDGADVADVTLWNGVSGRRVQARLRLGAGADAPTTDVLLYLPQARSAAPVPVFLGLNFSGNQAEHPDPGIRLATAWLGNDPGVGIVDNRATEASRGRNAHRFPVEAMLARGYGMATACCGDVVPDKPDCDLAAVRAAIGQPAAAGPDATGSVGIWAWQLARILDWLVTLPEVDAGKVIVFGHSRLGKAALWAGGCDERFAMVVSNESGCGGAALSRRNFGETVGQITKRFPHWFCPAFATFAGREADLPTDQHALVALAAPRPVYVASAVEDLWADPRGEFLACVAADPVWRLLGREGLGTTEFPPADRPVGRTVGYHVRTGRHELLPWDWARFADHADREVVGRTPPPGDGLPAFHPRQAPLPAKPPADAILLFGDGTTPDPPRFTNMAGDAIDWTVRDGALVVTPTTRHANHLVSTATFRDADIHAEFLIGPEARGNSGLYIHGHYEMQILDSAAAAPPTDQDEGALYKFGPPLVNAALPTGRWQVYDIRFIAPRRDPQGAIVKPGRVTAWLNGRLVQQDLEFTEPRSPYTPYRHGVTDHLRTIERRLLATGEGPLFLQEHASPVRFRNVWIRPLAGER